MSVHTPRVQSHITFQRNISDKEARKREAAMRTAERHYTAAEYAELMADMSANKVDVRVYDECIVLMRKF